MNRIWSLALVLFAVASASLFSAYGQGSVSGASSPSASGSRQVTVAPQGGGGGQYHGPGDIVPPVSPFPPSDTSCAQPCALDTLCAAPQENCRPCGKKISGSKFFLDWDLLPDCMNQSNNVVYEVRIKDLKAACANAGPDGVATVCLENLDNQCPSGVSRIFIYETIPFQSFPQGVPAANGNTIPVCGLVYQPEIDYGGFCQNLSEQLTGSYSCWANTFITPGCSLGCDTLEGIRLNVSCGCFQNILNVYQSLGLYHPTNASSFLNDNSVVFSVVVKCCDGSGGGDTCC